jgi:hypothetical protein
MTLLMQSRKAALRCGLANQKRKSRRMGMIRIDKGLLKMVERQGRYEGTRREGESNQRSDAAVESDMGQRGMMSIIKMPYLVICLLH